MRVFCTGFSLGLLLVSLMSGTEASSPFVPCKSQDQTYFCDADKQCIDLDKKCNGVDECSDGSDERACTSAFKCDGENLFKCKNIRFVFSLDSLDLLSNDSKSYFRAITLKYFRFNF